MRENFANTTQSVRRANFSTLDRLIYLLENYFKIFATNLELLVKVVTQL